MNKIIILFTILSQFLYGCSIKKDKEISITVDCPKHFLISEAVNKLYSNNSLLTLESNLTMNCYQINNNLDFVLIDILMNYELINLPEYELFENSYNALIFVTNREETSKILSSKNKINFSNKKNWRSNVKTPYLNKVDLQYSVNIEVSSKEYSKGIRVFAAVN